MDYEDRVAADDDFKAPERKRPLPPKATQTLVQYVYMVLFNQKALEQLLSCWTTYKDTKRMPAGLGAWSGVFSCLRSIRRWGPVDRLREKDLLQDVLESVDPEHRVPVEIELWPRRGEQRERTQALLRAEVEACGGIVLDTLVMPQIHYHAMLVELPHGRLQALLQQDVAWLQIDDIYLIRPRSWRRGGKGGGTLGKWAATISGVAGLQWKGVPVLFRSPSC